MMNRKKWIALILILVLLLILSACGQSARPAPTPEPTSIPEPTSEPTPAPTPTPTPEPQPILEAWGSFPDYGPEDAQAMSSWMNQGSALLEDGVYYGRFFQRNRNYAQTFRMELLKEGDSVQIGDWQVLDDSYCPRYLHKSGSTLFYVKNHGSSVQGTEGLVRVNADGSDYRILWEGECDCLCLRGGRLFFTDAEHQLVSTDTDGGDLRILVEREVYYAYPLDADWLLFQDDADNESLHLLHFPSGVELKLNDERSYRPILAGDKLYYEYVREDGSGCLARIDLASGGTETDPETGFLRPVFTVEHGDGLIREGYAADGETIWPDTGLAAVPAEAWASDWSGMDGLSGYVIRAVTPEYIITDKLTRSGNVAEILLIDRLTGVMAPLPWIH